MRLAIAMACVLGCQAEQGVPTQLVGTWARPEGNYALRRRLMLYRDGTFDEALTGDGQCNGTRLIMGAHWSATRDRLSLKFDGVCSGEAVCVTSPGTTVHTVCRDPTEAASSFEYHYSLSEDGSTLTLDWYPDSGIFTERFTRVS